MNIMNLIGEMKLQGINFYLDDKDQLRAKGKLTDAQRDKIWPLRIEIANYLMVDEVKDGYYPRYKRLGWPESIARKLADFHTNENQLAGQAFYTRKWTDRMWQAIIEGVDGQLYKTGKLEQQLDKVLIAIKKVA